MWSWILIGLSVITKVHGYASGYFPQSCESMSPQHVGTGGQFLPPQNTEPPFEVLYQHGKKGEPITGTETIGSLFLEACLSLLAFLQWSFTKCKVITIAVVICCPPLMNLKTIFQLFSRASIPQNSKDLCWRLERKAG